MSFAAYGRLKQCKCHLNPSFLKGDLDGFCRGEEPSPWATAGRPYKMPLAPPYQRVYKSVSQRL